TVDGSVSPMIHRDARFRLEALNVFGEKFMEVSPGTVTAPRVTPGDTLRAVEPPDINQVMEKAAGTVERLDLLAADLHATMARIQRGEGSIGKLLTSDELYAGLNRTVSRMHLLA